MRVATPSFFIIIKTSPTEFIMCSSIEDFIDYIYSFYNVVDGLYPVKGCTKVKIECAIHEYWKQIEKYPTVYTWGYGDSLDRERVRDIMFDMFPKIKYA
tara:strand:- start:95 stop:391 length:297 start_codon:yes stop_codon:yes gene_type:complete